MWGRCVLAILLAVCTTTGYALADVVVRVDLSRQRMHVIVNGSHYATWRVSTGRRGYGTPTGSHRPKLLKAEHYSSKFRGSPMPYSIFFRSGYAIHGTYEAGALGRPVSHGCIRLHPSNAAELFSLVHRHGTSNTQIIIRH
jgi:lipoprotein-anchoring transpeptidase ErfK/SrfK